MPYLKQIFDLLGEKVVVMFSGPILQTVGLLVASNTFMTFAWYGHLKQKNLPIQRAILMSWGLAFFEYTLMVPANRFGSQVLSLYQLKILQECITLGVFVAVAYFYFNQPLELKYGVALFLILLAVVITFKP